MYIKQLSKTQECQPKSPFFFLVFFSVAAVTVAFGRSAQSGSFLFVG